MDKNKKIDQEEINREAIAELKQLLETIGEDKLEKLERRVVVLNLELPLIIWYAIEFAARKTNSTASDVIAEWVVAEAQNQRLKARVMAAMAAIFGKPKD